MIAALAFNASWKASAPIEIFQGVTYGCDDLESSAEGSGLLHWVRVDLTAPGIGLYVTPLDPSAVAEGWQYRLRSIRSLMAEEQLAVAINGSLFTRQSRWLPALPGEFAKGIETVVADHVPSHLWEHTYLLWFDDQLKPHLRNAKPPTQKELADARWGVGGQAVGLSKGVVWSDSDRRRNARTAVAIDQDRMLLFLAVGENISPRLLLQRLADLGAKDGMLLDGGSSSSIAIGREARTVRPGTLHGGWRPVATFFGVKARPMGAQN